MKKILLVLIVLISYMGIAKAEEIQFFQGTYNEVVRAAKEQNKVIMIDFFTDWCKWCVELDRNVYTNSAVSGFANENQINWKIDAEKGEGPELAKNFGVDGYPTIVFLNPYEKEIDRIVGYLPASKFLEFLQDIKANKNTMQELKNSLSKTPDNLEVNFKIGEKLFNYGQTDNCKQYFEKIIKADPDNKSGFKSDAEFYIASMNPDISGIKNFVLNYPQSEKLKDAYMTLAEYEYFKNNDLEAANKYFNLIISKYGKNDEDFKMNYGNFLVSVMYSVYKVTVAGTDKLDKGFRAGEEAMEYVAGTINEASVNYYYSEFYYRQSNFKSALASIDKAISIFDKKDYKKQRDKILAKINN